MMPAIATPPAVKSPLARMRTGGLSAGAVAFASCLAAIITVHLLWLMGSPALFVDEAQGINWIMAHWQGDWAAQSMDRLFITSQWDGGLFGWTALPVFLAFGVGLAQARLVAFAWSLALLALTYVVGKRLAGAAVARGATLLLALSWPFWYSAHTFRVDVGVAVLGWGAIAAYLFAGRRVWLHALAGLLIGLGLTIHPNSAAFACGLGLVYLAERRLRVVISPEPWLAALGCVVGAALAVGPLAPSTLAQRSTDFGAWVSTSRMPPLLALSLPQTVAAELLRYVNLGHFGTLDLLLLLAALIWALGHRRTGGYATAVALGWHEPVLPAGGALQGCQLLHPDASGDLHPDGERGTSDRPRGARCALAARVRGRPGGGRGIAGG